MMVLRNRLPNSPEMYLAEWLGLMAGDQDSTIREIGAKISIALQEVCKQTVEIFSFISGIFRIQHRGY